MHLTSPAAAKTGRCIVPPTQCFTICQNSKEDAPQPLSGLAEDELEHLFEPASPGHLLRHYASSFLRNTGPFFRGREALFVAHVLRMFGLVRQVEAREGGGGAGGVLMACCPHLQSAVSLIVSAPLTFYPSKRCGSSCDIARRKHLARWPACPTRTPALKDCTAFYGATPPQVTGS